ncbi:MAG TPA: OmpA family protein, partial [Pricia antarctica]|nr:OmpA family protein [Pricia antarctica]
MLMHSIRIPSNSVLLLHLLFTCFAFPQNLIKNPSFEEFEQCPKKLGNFESDVVGWSTPTEGSTDYFNACSTAMGTPENFNGRQPAEFGLGYAGLYLYAAEDYREYLQAELIQPLKRGRVYEVSFFISLAERSDFAVREFGVLFAKNAMKIAIRKVLSRAHWYRQKENLYTYEEMDTGNFITNQEVWTTVSTQFVAKGGEKYMILGNLKNNARTRKIEIGPLAKQGAYYYIDQVEVKVANPINTLPETTNSYRTVVGKDSIPLDKTQVFESVLFEFDHFEILKTAEAEVRRIFNYLKANPGSNITITGHTDSIGQNDYNKRLSNQRAKAIADYLIALGIHENRINSRGHGGQKPIATN